MKKISIILLTSVLFALAGCANATDSNDLESDNCIVTELDVLELENTYTIVGTNQTLFYNNFDEMDEIDEGEDFYGQNANYLGNEPLYQDNCDGTVTDINTGLMWSQTTDINGDGVMTSDDKLSYDEAVASLDDLELAGYDDWRLPTIKELYSLILFSGYDVSGYEGDTDGLTPFIDTEYFDFYYGLTDEGERVIDSQYLSITKYVDTEAEELIFGVNFADGRIKGYGSKDPRTGEDKTFSIIYVRGNTEYGENNYTDNSDGTISDNATGLMWMSTGSTDTFNWEEALAYAEGMEYANYDDWRLPTVKELQSILDYSNSPGTTDSPAIDDLFTLTSFTNEAGETDWGYYWSSTTHANYSNGSYASYVSFGRAMGYMNGWRDVHGAGAQRSDPKSGDASAYPEGNGPQGDAIRINNYVILVRDIDSE